MLVKLTKDRKLSSDEQEKIKGGGIMSFFCVIFLSAADPDACGSPIDSELMYHMIDAESVRH